MKTITGIAIFVTAICSSCVKQYTCTCEYTFGGAEESIIIDSKKAAEKECSDLADQYVNYETCSLSQ